MRKAWKKFGFTLVELAISLAVLGLLISVALAPMRERMREADIRDTRDLLLDARNAVVGYAAVNATESRELLRFSGTKMIPQGRPFLPCPDIDGDGWEDRTPLGAGEPVNAPGVSTAHGVCVQYKGLLPWRTISGPESDKWGTHLTYRVDPHFSHRGLGFDYSTSADSASLFGLLEGGVAGANYPPRSALLNGRDIPSVICIHHGCMLAARDAATPVLDDLRNIKIGFLVTANALTVGRKTFRQWDSQGGPAFVILSHGRNRHGGVSADSGRCYPMGHEDDLHELQNAFYHPTHPLADVIAGRGCYTRSPVPTAGPGASLDESVFVDRPPAVGFVDDARHMDDIVLWMSANELARELTDAGALPARELEFLR